MKKDEEYKLVFEIIEIEDNLYGRKDDLKYLQFLLNKYDLIYNHFSDDDIEKLLIKLKLQTNYKRTIRNRWNEQDPRQIYSSEYRDFKEKIGSKLMGYVNSKIENLRISPIHHEDVIIDNKVKETRKFIWNDTESSIIFLFESLVQAGLIQNTQIPITISHTFLNSSGMAFKNTQLGKKSIIKKINTDKFENLIKIIQKKLNNQ